MYLCRVAKFWLGDLQVVAAGGFLVSCDCEGSLGDQSWSYIFGSMWLTFRTSGSGARGRMAPRDKEISYSNRDGASTCVQASGDSDVRLFSDDRGQCYLDSWSAQHVKRSRKGKPVLDAAPCLYRFARRGDPHSAAIATDQGFHWPRTGTVPTFFPDSTASTCTCQLHSRAHLSMQSSSPLPAGSHVGCLASRPNLGMDNANNPSVIHP